ncbi:baseplate J protein [Salinivibrio proteolyticus]|uniref:baseplate J/gp47 family protein n=1 Tax=Salinivibrio proteolyticus TaxID=334715 RepID=UPI0009895192|nr:baseplate J/gp47 family protein [Salinivibrio proteolyticus]OOF25049.1 baseplate J protein [Salinivibrio proteolyticus]
MTNQVPQAFTTPDFETLLTNYKQHVIEYVAAKDPDNREAVTEALNNEGELLAQVLEALMTKRLAEKREDNHQALQMFRRFVTESEMVDLLALQYNLKRQTIEPADTSVFPPKPAVMESDEDLLRRFDLAPYQFHTTGTRMGYKFHALTLDERPTISIETTETGVLMRYDFPTESQPALVKDAEPRMREPNSGKVDVALLSRETEDGTPSAALIARAEQYLNRDDIAQESDEITVVPARITPYRIHATLFTGGEPAHDVNQADAVATAQQFAESQHRLNTRIDRLKLGELLYSLNPKRVELHEPAADIVCDWDEAPHCTEVIIDVKAN